MRSLLGVESGPDYTYLYNMLYPLGYRADITVLTRSFTRIPLDIQMEMFRYNPGLDQEQCRLLLDYLEANDKVSFQKGEPWIQRHHKDAVIWVNNNSYAKGETMKKTALVIIAIVILIMPPGNFGCTAEITEPNLQSPRRSSASRRHHQGIHKHKHVLLLLVWRSHERDHS
jgi:hypothetical protein